MSANRYVLLVVHTGRAEAIAAAAEACVGLSSAGITPVMTGGDLLECAKHVSPVWAQVRELDVAGLVSAGEAIAAGDLELVMVLGGDGTILKAAELVREQQVPLLGVNLGRVGFLAEVEREDLTETVRRIVTFDYIVKERLTLDVAVVVKGKETYRSWALNEATVEKSARERMLEVVIEIDRRPLSSFGCDGIVMSTPTGSTAYSFSAGGPVVWPSVEALLLTPLSAHALFARPMVVNPNSLMAVEVMRSSAGTGVLWCDGRRTHELPPGARVEVRRSQKPVRIARLHDAPFTDRLVKKFALPVVGWRGPERNPEPYQN
jgi:NAD+ kinase